MGEITSIFQISLHVVLCVVHYPKLYFTVKYLSVHPSTIIIISPSGFCKHSSLSHILYICCVSAVSSLDFPSSDFHHSTFLVRFSFVDFQHQIFLTLSSHEFAHGTLISRFSSKMLSSLKVSSLHFFFPVDFAHQTFITTSHSSQDFHHSIFQTLPSLDFHRSTYLTIFSPLSA